LVFASERDTDTLRVAPGLEFAPSALISGMVHVGYRRFTPADERLPEYTGPVAAVDIQYVMRGATRFSYYVQRDVQYSFNPLTPYYVSTGTGGGVTQRVTPVWEVGGRLGVENLAYQAADIGEQSESGYSDRVTHYGGLIGYVFGRTATFRVHGDYYFRISGIDDREYEGLRVGTSIVYGF
jgi:hypothetical protein